MWFIRDDYNVFILEEIERLFREEDGTPWSLHDGEAKERMVFRKRFHLTFFRCII